MQKLLELDGAILLWIQAHVRNDILTPLVKGITYLGQGGWLMIAACLVLMAIPRTRRLGLVCSVSLGFEFIIGNLVLKDLVGRIRPYDAIDGLSRLVGEQPDWSFPSGHSGAAFAVAFVIFLKAPRRIGVPVLILAILIALSRLYVGVHYPTDVLAGTAIGIGFACLSCFILRGLFLHKKTAGGAVEEEKAGDEDDG